MPARQTLFLFLIVFNFCACNQAHYQEVKSKHTGQKIPNLNIISPDSSHHITTHDIPDGPAIVLLYFKPECPYCRAEITSILENLSTFKGVNFYLIAGSASSLLNIFTNNIQRRHIPNFFIGIDYKHDFQNYFSPQGVPFTAIYRNEKTLGKSYMGALSSKELAGVIND